ncbi:MAG: hypothetical protein Hyperionvirus17_44, partial [Hyperionvirus sp.]
PKPLYLHIFSIGGLIFAGMMGADQVKNSKIPIYSIIEGMVASAATFITIVARKRFMTENSYMLIHQLSSVETGNFEQLTDQHVNNENLMKHSKKLYMAHTKLTSKQLDEIMKHDIFWDFTKAKKCGFVDEIYEQKQAYVTTECAGN